MVSRAKSKTWTVAVMAALAACGCSSAMLAPDAGNKPDAGNDQSTATPDAWNDLEAGNDRSTATLDAGNDQDAGNKLDAGTDQSTATIPACTSQLMTDPAMSAADFCAIFLNGCSNVSGFTIPTGYTTLEMCETSYAALTEALRMCRSYHLCMAVSPNMGTTNLHCLHATGVGNCIAN